MSLAKVLLALSLALGFGGVNVYADNHEDGDEMTMPADDHADHDAAFEDEGEMTETTPAAKPAPTAKKADKPSKMAAKKPKKAAKKAKKNRG